jgi:hypothetical protein
MTDQRPAPEIPGNLRSTYIRLPDCIRECGGIVVLNRHIRSLVFSTDVAIIRNTNADAVIAVYPFTPQPIITHAIILAADIPVFCGIGGSITSGDRAVELALDAEFQGALGVVVNQPTPIQVIERLKSRLEIPVVATVVSEHNDFKARMDAGVDIINVSGATRTPEIVRKIKAINLSFPVIATGGGTEKTIRRTIEAGADAITFTPPTTGALYKKLMDRYREEAGG